jgi:hypothetical protein
MLWFIQGYILELPTSLFFLYKTNLPTYDLSWITYVSK